MTASRTNRLKGHEALEYAREHEGTVLGKFADPVEGDRDDLDLEEAEEVAREDIGLVYVDVQAAEGGRAMQTIHSTHHDACHAAVDAMMSDGRFAGLLRRRSAAHGSAEGALRTYLTAHERQPAEARQAYRDLVGTLDEESASWLTAEARGRVR